MRQQEEDKDQSSETNLAEHEPGYAPMKRCIAASVEFSKHAESFLHCSRIDAKF